MFVRVAKNVKFHLLKKLNTMGSKSIVGAYIYCFDIVKTWRDRLARLGLLEITIVVYMPLPRLGVVAQTRMF